MYCVTFDVDDLLHVDSRNHPGGRNLNVLKYNTHI